MYCPKCSQAQSSEEMRFCSRCGFPLELVGVLIANNGTIPAVSNSVPAKSKRGVMAEESVIVMIFAWAVAILATLAFDWGGPLEFVAKFGAILGLVVGLIALVRFLYVFLFVKVDEVEQSPPGKDLSHAYERSSLPPPQSQPISSWQRPSSTREMVERPSVTENTTRLLDENDRQ